MYMELSDKGWLRSHLPTATATDIYRFIEKVGIKLDHLRQPSLEQINCARLEAFNEMMGLVE